MDESERLDEAASLPAPRLHWRTPSTVPVPADFIALHLVLQPGNATIELTQPDLLVGRHSTADVRLPLPDVSRRHCRFIFSEGIWQVLDLNSLNGVFLNDEPVRQASLRQGDLLRIGGFTFVVELGGQQTDDDGASDSLIRGIFRTLPSPSYGPEGRRRSA